MRCISIFQNGILTAVPGDGDEGVPWPDFIRAVDYKFQQQVEGNKPESAARFGLSNLARNHFARKFFGDRTEYESCRVRWDMFFKVRKDSSF